MFLDCCEIGRDGRAETRQLKQPRFTSSKVVSLQTTSRKVPPFSRQLASSQGLLVAGSALEAGMSEVLSSKNGTMIDPIFAEGVLHLLAAKYFMLASFVVLIYDHILTFSNEVDRIWQREWTGATWLFALNRYLTELQFIVNLVSFHAPSWTGKACEKFIGFAGGSTLVSVAIAEIVLILRTYALYQRSRYILAILASMWCGQVVIMATTMLNATQVPLPPGLIGCIQGGQGRYTAAFWLAPLVMDTVITALTVFKTARFLSQEHGRVRLVHVILRDGLLYFAVILVANLSNCLAYYLAPPDLKVIGASFSNIITIMMISRLQLNLRSDSICSPDIDDTVLSLPYGAERKGESRTSTFTSSLSQFFRDTVMELGKEIGEEVAAGKTEAKTSARSRSVVDVEPAREIEMIPIRPIGGGIGEIGVPTRDSLAFDIEEIK